MNVEYCKARLCPDFTSLPTSEILNRVNGWSHQEISIPLWEEIIGRLLTNPDYSRLLYMTQQEADELLFRYCNEQCLPDEVDFVERRYVQLLEIMGVNPGDL